MKKIIFFIIFLLSSISYGQKSVDATIILHNNDTVQSKLRVKTNLFDSKLIKPNSFYLKLTLIDTEGKKNKISFNIVKELYFTDFKGVDRKFVHSEKDRLIELIFDGEKIKWYRRYAENPYDGSILFTEYLKDSEGKIYSFTSLFTSRRKVLKEATKAKPELEAEIDAPPILKDVNILYILNKYEN